MRFLPETEAVTKPQSATSVCHHPAAVAERLLWHRLQTQMPAGLTIKRGHPIGPYQVAFACPDRRLAVDLDEGPQNSDPGGVRNRQRRDCLAMRGYHVLTIEREALTDDRIADVVDLIVAELLACEVVEYPDLEDP